MKWYSEDELKKWIGWPITYPLLNQMKFEEMQQCKDCDYWTPPTHDTFNFQRGICRIFKTFTNHDRPCKVNTKW